MNQKQITLLDGSIGQEMVKRSGERATPLWSTTVMIDNPGLVNQIHKDYFSAGATVATTNTYSILYNRLKKFKLEKDRFKLWDIAVDAAIQARNHHGFGVVAASIGPLIASYRPDICPPSNEAECLYEEITSVLSTQVDLLLIETMSSIDQADGALRAVKKCDKPFWVAFSVDDFDGSKLRSGENLSDIKIILNQHNPDAVLINCSRPEAVSKAVRVISKFGFKFGAYANGFTKINSQFLKDSPTVDALERRIDLLPRDYARFVLDWVKLGATIVGGCCEVGPEHIKEIANKLTSAGYEIV